MSKPKTIILKDGEKDFKEFCVMFKAKYCWWDGVKYRLPEEWK